MRDSVRNLVAHTLLQTQTCTYPRQRPISNRRRSWSSTTSCTSTKTIRIELTNDTKVPLVVNNTAHSPKKVFHIRPTGSIHTESSVYAKVLHAELHDGTQINVVDHFDSEVTDLQTDVENLLDKVDEATPLDDGSDKVVKRDSANMTVINNLIVKADESNRSTSLYPPPGLLFDKAICETNLTCVGNAQVIFQPYNSAGAEITGRSYQFGRAEDADDEKDGLHFQDITNAQDHMRVRLNVGKTQPSLLLVGKKNLGVPMFEIRRHHVRGGRGGRRRVQGARERHPHE